MATQVGYGKSMGESPSVDTESYSNRATHSSASQGDGYELNLADPGQWVSDHGEALYGYAMSRVRRSDVAEDLVQETLLSALKAAHGFEGRSTERTWLIGILRHKVLDYFRRMGRSKEVQAPELGEGAGSLGLFTKRGRWKPKPQAWGDDPAHLYEQAEFWQVYEACRAMLPTTLAEAYTLRELEGLSQQDVCKTLGITATNLSVRLHRARLALRHCLEERWHSD